MLMNKKTLVLSAVGILFFIAIVTIALSLRSPQPSPAQKTNTPTAATPKKEPTSDPSPIVAGSYREYTESAVQGDTAAKRILFFHAPWCPQCRALDEDIKSAAIPNDVTIYKVDYDTNQELRKKYSVTLQTTFVSIDKSGDQVDKYVAYQSPTFESVINNMLSD